MTIACVYVPGRGFTSDYVTRLQAGVHEHCHRDHRFVCLTNEKIDGVETLPLRRELLGFWNKLELFGKGLFAGPVAYFDLDTIIRNDITDLVETPWDFAALTIWDQPEKYLASGVMVWDGRLDFSYLLDLFRPASVEKYRRSWVRSGDQGYIQDHLRGGFEDLNALFPGRFVSYKRHCRNGVPPGASVVCFHGRPRPHEIAWRLPDVRSAA